jgi:hypothetical protein
MKCAPFTHGRDVHPLRRNGEQVSDYSYYTKSCEMCQTNNVEKYSLFLPH